MAGAWTTERYAALGIPTASENPFAGDGALEAAPTYTFADAAAGDQLPGTPRFRRAHGQRPEHADIDAFFLATGVAIRRGIALDAITSRDVAPTLAHVLGVGMDCVEGA